MNNIIEKIKTTRILATIGIIALIVGTIMPYVKYEIWTYKYSISLWSFWEGKVIMLLVLANVLFIFKDIVEKYVPFLFNSTIGRKVQECNNQKYSLIPTILVAAITLYLNMGQGVELFEYYSIGFYSLWIGTISLVVYAFLHKNNEEYR